MTLTMIDNRNGNMATQTGNTFISSNGISTTASSKKVPLGECNTDRQPETDTKTGNTYMCETVTDNIEIPTKNLEFTTIASL